MLIQKSWKILQGVLQSPIDEHSPKQKKELGLCLFINPKLLKLFGVICKTSILFCTYLHLYLYLYLHLHLYPSVCLSICLSIFIYLFMYLYIESRINHRLLTPRQVTRPRFGACAGWADPRRERLEPGPFLGRISARKVVSSTRQTWDVNHEIGDFTRKWCDISYKWPETNQQDKTLGFHRKDGDLWLNQDGFVMDLSQTHRVLCHFFYKFCQ